MLKSKIEQFLLKVKPYLKKVKPYTKKCVGWIKKVYKKTASYLKSKITSWWQIVAIVMFCVVFLYYPLGGFIIHEIDTSSNFQPETSDGRLASVDTMSHLINREVHHKLWTPNLPFLFPSYFLDNMPSFQLGIMSSISHMALAIDSIPLSKASEKARKARTDGTRLLQYPGNVWLFSPQNKLLPVSSSNTQYKKGRKNYNIFNHEIAKGNATIDRTSQNLLLLMLVIKRDFEASLHKTASHIREKSSDIIDTSADEVFYHEKGRLYAYSQILRALSHDFKDTMIRYDIYQQWTSLLSTLDKGGVFDASIIRNAAPNSSLAPNHLVVINYLTSKSLNQINDIITKLDKQTDIKQ